MSNDYSGNPVFWFNKNDGYIFYPQDHEAIKAFSDWKKYKFIEEYIFENESGAV